MSTSLARAIDSGDYQIDAGAVAEAILRRTRVFGDDAPVIASQVFVPADFFDDPAPGSDQLEALALDNDA